MPPQIVASALALAEKSVRVGIHTTLPNCTGVPMGRANGESGLTGTEENLGRCVRVYRLSLKASDRSSIRHGLLQSSFLASTIPLTKSI